LVTLSETAGIQFSENFPKLDGSTALYPVFASFAQATYPSTENYSDLSNGVVRCTKTPNAFTNLINGNVDIIFTAAPSQQQEKMAEEQGKTFVKTPIGKDAFVFFVHKNNPVNGLTIEQIQGIYSGRITNWAEVGGSDIEIVAYQRPENSGSQTALEAIMDGIRIMTPPSDWLDQGMTGGFQRIVEYRNHSRAVGFSFLFFTTEMVNSNEIKLLAIEGVPPTRETIRANQYPFSGAFYAITTGNETENTKKLMEWVLSDEGQYLIEKTGYVPILPAAN
jgi:phosphate transport system substrate-binding protein